jgi:hypothetical protein
MFDLSFIGSIRRLSKITCKNSGELVETARPLWQCSFHDRNSAGRDISLLKFMADRAVETARLPTDAATAASSHKAIQIDRMASITTSSGCFRESLVGYFTGPKRFARRSFSTWLLELVFADRAVRQQKVICCDACQQRLIIGQGPLAFVKKVLVH